MGFRQVRLYHFRNLADGVLPLEAPQVFLVGPNGQGKSNLLEALYVLSYGGSFRTRRDQELCKDDTADMALDGLYSDDHGDLEVAVRFKDNRKTIRVDNQPIGDRRDLVSRIPTVIFRHDDMAFVNGSPDMQRWFVDQTLSMYQPQYIDVLRRYRRILQNRNQVIRDGSNEAMLSVYDRQLAEAGLELLQQRHIVLQAFNRVFQEEFLYISRLEHPLVIEYRPGWRNLETVEGVMEHLHGRREQEAALRTTTSGPHRDRMLFRVDGVDFLQRASTGQIRLVALILRVAQARFFREKTRRKPVLLLDDVLLELDGERRTRLVERLPESAQRVFTFLPGEPYGDYQTGETLVYGVDHGTFTGTERRGSDSPPG